jgi:PPOX class probable F420-dependent enzyme
MPPLDQFAGHEYLNLESYRRSGAPVRTPVWFAGDGGVLYIYTLADAGKVKRIRREPRVRIVPCSFRGEPRGQWIDAEARVAEPPEAERGHRLLDRKYGWKKKVGNLWSGLLGRRRVVITLTPASNS